MGTCPRQTHGTLLLLVAYEDLDVHEDGLARATHVQVFGLFALRARLLVFFIAILVDKVVFERLFNFIFFVFFCANSGERKISMRGNSERKVCEFGYCQKGKKTREGRAR